MGYDVLLISHGLMLYFFLVLQPVDHYTIHHKIIISITLTAYIPIEHLRGDSQFNASSYIIRKKFSKDEWTKSDGSGKYSSIAYKYQADI
jgi:hypothetical protein